MNGLISDRTQCLDVPCPSVVKQSNFGIESKSGELELVGISLFSISEDGV